MSVTRQRHLLETIDLGQIGFTFRPQCMNSLLPCLQPPLLELLRLVRLGTPEEGHHGIILLPGATDGQHADHGAGAAIALYQ
jgi:hypothetical protein